MPNLLQFNPAQFIGFFVIFARISGVMITAPVLNDATIPVQVKVGFTFLLSLVFLPLLTKSPLGANPNVAQLVVLMVGEVGAGLLLGFAAQLLFAGISLAGEVVGFSMGINMSHVLDPTFEAQVSIISEIKTVVALMLFVALNGHLLFIESIAKSYEVLPAGSVMLGQAGVAQYMGLATRMFYLGLQAGAPLIVALLAANFSLGLVSRAVPQVNIFFVGVPFTIALGLMLLTLSMPFYVSSLTDLFGSMQELLLSSMRALR